MKHIQIKCWSISNLCKNLLNLTLLSSLLLQGLKGSSTFGKKLRKSTAKTSPASSSSTTSVASAPSALSSLDNTMGLSHKRRIYKTDAVINIQLQHNPDNAIQQEKAQWTITRKRRKERKKDKTRTWEKITKSEQNQWNNQRIISANDNNK